MTAPRLTGSLIADALRQLPFRPPRVLLVLDRDEQTAWKSFRNLGERVQIILPEELNAYDVLVNDWLVFSSPTLEVIVSRLTDSGGGRATSIDVVDANAGGDAS